MLGIFLFYDHTTMSVWCFFEVRNSYADILTTEEKVLYSQRFGRMSPDSESTFPKEIL